MYKNGFKTRLVPIGEFANGPPTYWPRIREGGRDTRARHGRRSLYRSDMMISCQT